jgi:ketosteroid isomerase-like protein
MTIEELLAREAIRHTLAAYTIAGDLRSVDAFVEVFAEDAVFRSSVFDLVGRPAIERWFRDRAECAAPARFVRHNLGTCLIQLVGGEEATARTYFNVFSDGGPDHGGVYIDRFRRVGDRWLIAARVISMDWTRADSVLVPPAARVGITVIDSR